MVNDSIAPQYCNKIIFNSNTYRNKAYGNRWPSQALNLCAAQIPDHTTVGRTIDQQIRQLIRRMSSANPLWGTPRNVGELRKLGIEVAKPTADKYCVRLRKPSRSSGDCRVRHLPER